MSSVNRFRSSRTGREVCFRLKASNCRVSVAARSPADADLFDVLVAVIGDVDFVLEKTAVAGDYRQKIIEVVRDPAGQTADAFHFLRLPQFGFELQPVRYVVPRRNETGEVAGLVINGSNGSLRVIERAIFLSIDKLSGPHVPF